MLSKFQENSSHFDDGDHCWAILSIRHWVSFHCVCYANLKSRNVTRTCFVCALNCYLKWKRKRKMLCMCLKAIMWYRSNRNKLKKNIIIIVIVVNGLFFGVIISFSLVLLRFITMNVVIQNEMTTTTKNRGNNTILHILIFHKWNSSIQNNKKVIKPCDRVSI